MHYGSGLVGVLFFFDGVWANALPAADFELSLVRPSVKVLDAAVAASLPVCFFGAACDSALPAADLDDFPVDSDAKVREASVATESLVTFEFFFDTNLLLRNPGSFRNSLIAAKSVSR